ncbi:hypothetical protein PVAP13_1KG025900 [Panicum virgatum]|uniref:Uncharacterized protein n=1 Tax=Panicum virgatum TaxID=38727 RepID=A0A8T0X9H0_PANVG|nr:hypothetical protein PVAP13_1KG025900 [Panicum virgatum]
MEHMPRRSCPGFEEPYSTGSDADGGGEDDDEAVSSEEQDQLPLTSMAKRFSLVQSMEIPNSNGGCARQVRPRLWHFKTKGTYGYGNALWPKDGLAGGSVGGIRSSPERIFTAVATESTVI